MNKKLKMIVNVILYEAGFDPEINQQSNPRFNSEMASVPMALLIQLNNEVNRKPKPGTIRYNIPNMIPVCEAGKKVEVITFDEFSSGEPATNARYSWPLPDLQKAVFIRILEGKRAGKVSISYAGCLLEERPL